MRSASASASACSTRNLTGLVQIATESIIPVLASIIVVYDGDTHLDFRHREVLQHVVLQEMLLVRCKAVVCGKDYMHGYRGDLPSQHWCIETKSGPLDHRAVLHSTDMVTLFFPELPKICTVSSILSWSRESDPATCTNLCLRAYNSPCDNELCENSKQKCENSQQKNSSSLPENVKYGLAHVCRGLQLPDDRIQRHHQEVCWYRCVIFRNSFQNLRNEEVCICVGTPKENVRGHTPVMYF